MMIFSPAGTLSRAMSELFNSTDCSPTGIIFSAERGEITSPGYPNNYNNGTYCRYLIQVVEGSRIELTIDDFLTENTHDLLEVYDNDNLAMLLGRYSGSMVRNPTVISTTNKMLLIFKSDRSVNKRGFKLSYRSVNESGK